LTELNRMPINGERTRDAEANTIQDRTTEGTRKILRIYMPVIDLW